MAAGIHIETNREPFAASWELSREELEVRLWRFEQLVAHGFGLDDAATLARDPRVDLAAARSLVARGCPPALAARILA